MNCCARSMLTHLLSLSLSVCSPAPPRGGESPSPPPPPGRRCRRRCPPPTACCAWLLLLATLLCLIHFTWELSRLLHRSNLRDVSTSMMPSRQALPNRPRMSAAEVGELNVQPRIEVSKIFSQPKLAKYRVSAGSQCEGQAWRRGLGMAGCDSRFQAACRVRAVVQLAGQVRDAHEQPACTLLTYLAAAPCPSHPCRTCTSRPWRPSRRCPTPTPRASSSRPPSTVGGAAAAG